MTDQEILTSLSQPHRTPAPFPGSLARMLNAASKESAPLSIMLPLPNSTFHLPLPCILTTPHGSCRGHVDWVPQLLRAITPFFHQQDNTSLARLCCDWPVVIVPAEGGGARRFPGTQGRCRREWSRIVLQSRPCLCL